MTKGRTLADPPLLRTMAWESFVSLWGQRFPKPSSYEGNGEHA